MSLLPPSLRTKSALDAIYLPLFLGMLAFAFLSLALPIYSRELGADAVQIGGLFSVFTVVTLVLRPVVGFAIDRYGRRRFFVAALGTYALTMLLFAYSSSLAHLYVARLAQGVASSLMWITIYTIVADLSSPEEYGARMGRVNATSAQANVVGALGGFFLFMQLGGGGQGWRVVFLSYALLAAVGALLAWRKLPESLPSTPAASLIDKQENRVVAPRSLKHLMGITFFTALTGSMIAPIYLIFLQDRFTTDPASLGLAFLPYGLVYSLLAGRMGSLSDRWGRAPLMAAGMLLAGLLSLLLPQLGSLFAVAVLYTLAAAGWAMADPARTAMVADLAGSRTRGRQYGLYDLVTGLGNSVGPLLGGLLYDHAGRTIPFYLDGAVLGLAALWALLFLRQTRSSLNRSTN